MVILTELIFELDVDVEDRFVVEYHLVQSCKTFEVKRFGAKFLVSLVLVEAKFELLMD